MNILFFGSTTDSVIVLNKLSNLPAQAGVIAIVTQPPRPFGRDNIITPTPVETWGKTHAITTLSFESDATKPWLYKNEQQVIDTLQSVHADILISASYGQRIPWETISKAPLGGINVHPSILPRWRGADPVPWAILSGDHQIGVTIVRLSEKFDEGEILAQKKIPILQTDTSGPLRTKLFQIGADLLINTLEIHTHVQKNFKTQSLETHTYARKFTRDDGFETWENIINPKEAERIERKYRALHPWPGIWSIYNGKRIKILEFTHTPTIIQLEGKKAVDFKQFQKAYIDNRC